MSKGLLKYTKALLFPRKDKLMAKRFSALLTAAVIAAALLLTGCVAKPPEHLELTATEFRPEGAQLTIAEYREALKSAFRDYYEILDTVPLSKENNTVMEMKPYWNEASRSCRKCVEALDKFTVINPPDEFTEQHKELLAGVDTEKKYVAALERYLTAPNKKDLEKYNEECAALAGLPLDQKLAGKWGKLYKELRDVLGPDPDEPPVIY